MKVRTYRTKEAIMKRKKSYDGVTVMLDLDVLDTSDDCCEECNALDDGRCESCQTWVEETGEEIEGRVFKRFPGCSVVWLQECDMGSYAAPNPYCMGCPDDIYEAVLG